MSLAFLVGFGMLPFLPLAGLAIADVMPALVLAAIVATLDLLIIFGALSAASDLPGSAQAGMIVVAEPVVAFRVVGAIAGPFLIVRASERSADQRRG